MSSVEIIKRDYKRRPVHHPTERTARVFIPINILSDSQYPLEGDVCVVSIIKIRMLNGKERVGVFFEPPEKLEDDLY